MTQSLAQTTELDAIANQVLDRLTELDENQTDTEMNGSEKLYASIGRESKGNLLLALTIPKNLPPVTIHGYSLAWTQEALNYFAIIQKEKQSLPYTWFRELIELSLPNISRLEPNMGLDPKSLKPYNRKSPNPFAYLNEQENQDINKDLRSLLNEWITDSLNHYAEGDEKSKNAIAQLRELQDKCELFSIRPISCALPWPCSEETGTALGKNTQYFRFFAEYAARQIAGKEIFQGLGTIKRIITHQGGKTSGAIQLITDPIPEKEYFSLVINLNVVTFPSLPQPLLTIDVSKRLWASKLVDKSYKQKKINGLFFSKKHSDRAFCYSVRYEKNKQKNEKNNKNGNWKTDSAFDALNRKIRESIQSFNGYEIAERKASTEDCKVVLTQRYGIQDKKESNGVLLGVPEIDKLEAFKEIVKILEPLGLKPFTDYSPIKSNSLKTEDRTINLSTLLSAVLEKLETDRNSDFTEDYLKNLGKDKSIELLQTYFQIHPDGIQENEKKLFEQKSQIGELNQIINANQEAIQQMYPDENPLLVIFFESMDRGEKKLIETAVKVFFGNTGNPDDIEIWSNQLPEYTHGAKESLPGKTLKSSERFQERINAWKGSITEISELKRRTFCLVVAKEWFNKKHDDKVNKLATRQVLSSFAGSCVQFLRPSQKTKKGKLELENLFHRIQTATKELLFAHSARIDGVSKKVKDWMNISEEKQPKEIIGITIVRKNRDRFLGFDPTFIPIAIRINVEDGNCEMCCTYCDESNQVQTSTWEKFPDAISTISQISPVRLADIKEDNYRDKTQDRFMEFVEKVISNSVNEGKQPLVMIESTNCATLWGWLNDKKIDAENIDLSRKNRILSMRMHQEWKGARIVRIRQGYAPRLIEDKAHQLVESSLEDDRPKKELKKLQPDLEIPAPSAQISGLFRLNVPAEETANNKSNRSRLECINYFSIQHEGKTRKIRGLSCYRTLTIAKEYWDKKDGRSQQQKSMAGQKLYKQQELEPFKKQWATPKALEIVVTLRQEGDDPDRIAGLVESLRYGFGHYNKWTALPAPLFFARVVRDYISSFVLEDIALEDDEEDIE